MEHTWLLRSSFGYIIYLSQGLIFNSPLMYNLYFSPGIHLLRTNPWHRPFYNCQCDASDISTTNINNLIIDPNTMTMHSTLQTNMELTLTSPLSLLAGCLPLWALHDGSLSSMRWTFLHQSSLSCPPLGLSHWIVIIVARRCGWHGRKRFEFLLILRNGRQRSLLWDIVEIWLDLRVWCQLDSGALDLLTPHEHGKTRLASQEKFMVVGSSVSPLGDALEAPQVQLASEGHKFQLFEEAREYDLPELLCVSDNEGPSVHKPCDDVVHVTSVQHFH